MADGFRQMIFDTGIHHQTSRPLDPSRIVLRSTDLLESTGGFSLGGFSSLCCYAALGRDHHLALPAGASAFAVTEFIVAVDSVGKFQDQPGCQRPLPTRVLGLRLWAPASVSRPLNSDDGVCKSVDLLFASHRARMCTACPGLCQTFPQFSP